MDNPDTVDGAYYSQPRWHPAKENALLRQTFPVEWPLTAAEMMDGEMPQGFVSRNHGDGPTLSEVFGQEED